MKWPAGAGVWQVWQAGGHGEGRRKAAWAGPGYCKQLPGAAPGGSQPRVEERGENKQPFIVLCDVIAASFAILPPLFCAICLKN